jgi:hypothetical protein
VKSLVNFGNKFSNRAWDLVFTLILLAIVGSMTILGTSGSTIIFAIQASLANWGDLIGLGFAVGIVMIFLSLGEG